MSYLGLKHLYLNFDDCYNLFKIAIYVSNYQKYTNFDLFLKYGKSTPESLEIVGDFK